MLMVTALAADAQCQRGYITDTRPNVFVFLGMDSPLHPDEVYLSANTTLRIHYDAGWENRLFVRGDGPSLDWEKGIEATWRNGNVWMVKFPNPEGITEFKVLINDTVWNIGSNYRVESGETHDFYPHFYRREGRLEVMYHFDTPIVIYLPPSYEENPFKHYPVIYMHDGQNLFDPATAFGGQAWAVDKTINRLVTKGEMEEVIAVGIYNRGAARIHDFTPSHDPNFMGVGAGGGGSVRAGRARRR